MNNLEVLAIANLNKYVTKQDLAKAIATVDGLKRKIVLSMSEIIPTAPDAESYIYMVQRDNTEENNIYDEYMVIDKKIEAIGSTEVDLSNYVKSSDYATNSNGGVFRTSTGYATAVNISNGYLYTTVRTANQYKTDLNGTFVGKGTLENLAEEWSFVDSEGNTFTKRVVVSPIN